LDSFSQTNGSGNGYDGLNRLVAFSRGTLNSTNDTISSPTHSQSYTLDSQGNFSTVVTDSSTQTRTHNQQNQIASITSLTTPVYDSNGNLTTDERGQTLKFDAWNRLVQVKNSGGTVIQTYTYDALGRRITENPGTVRHFYFSAAGQVVEERVGTSTSADTQYVWSPVNVNALIEFDPQSHRYYVEQDANFDVTSITVEWNNTVQFRYIYDPYGQRSTLTASWHPTSDTSGLYIGWQGLRIDVTTGYVYNNARWYSPTLYVFASQDPAGYIDGPNLYASRGDGPVGAVDPSGLAWSWSGAIAGGLAGAYMFNPLGGFLAGGFATPALPAPVQATIENAVTGIPGGYWEEALNFTRKAIFNEARELLDHPFKYYFTRVDPIFSSAYRTLALGSAIVNAPQAARDIGQAWQENPWRVIGRVGFQIHVLWGSVIAGRWFEACPGGNAANTPGRGVWGLNPFVLV